MIEVNGAYNKAIIYSNSYDEGAYNQLLDICNYKHFEGANIKVMPDYHAGKGCVIGFTSVETPVLIPNLIGVDIGCGVLAVKLSNPIDVKELDNFIRRDIPSGFDVNEEIQPFYWFVPLEKLNCFKHLNKVERLKKSLGSLGGGNHFIELDVDSEGNQWLVIHSGSRNLGKQVANYYQELAKSYDFSKDLDDLIEKTPEKEREEKIKEFKERFYALKGLEFLRGDDYFYYLNDMKFCQEFAHYNRYQIATAILVRFGMTLGGCEKIESVHNYYDFTDGVIRKGAISARNGEKCIIPMNMRDGSLICVGKGNPDWNYSAPHGAGRLMSRAEAKETLTMDEFKESMQGIYSSCIKESTLDEAPMAYKPMGEIVEQIGDTVEIIDIIKPIYNFKA